MNLLLTQLSAEQQRPLSIKDIGIILERLSARVIDVDRLERETEASDTRHWTIRAVVRGGEGSMRELGVLYNSNYYSIGEHPGYRSSLDEDDDDDEGDEIEDEEVADVRQQQLRKSVVDDGGPGRPARDQ